MWRVPMPVPPVPAGSRCPAHRRARVGLRRAVSDPGVGSIGPAETPRCPHDLREAPGRWVLDHSARAKRYGQVSFSVSIEEVTVPLAFTVRW